MTKPTIAVAFICLALLSNSASAAEESSSDVAKTKKVVSRLYQATYLARERCKSAPPAVAKEFNDEFARFETQNATLMTLLTEAPTYESVRTQYAQRAVIDPVKDTPERLTQECTSIAQLLQSMRESEGGRNAAKEFEALLSK